MNPLTDFQLGCEAKLRAALGERGLSLMSRQIAGRSMTYLVSEIPEKNIKLWIYEKEAMFTASEKDYIYEAPDYRDQNKLMTAFVSAVVVCAEGGVPTDRGSARISLFNGKEI